MKAKFLVTVLFLICLVPLAYSLDAKGKMDDAMARAYKTATEKKLDEAKDWFRKASEYAKEVQSWPGLLDAGYGLSTMGEPEQATSCFDSASEVVSKNKDWHGAVALGYAYASLPEKSNTEKRAIRMWTEAKDWAKQTQDWTGLIEAGRGFMSINKNREAEECFDLAKSIIEEAPTENGIKALVNAYRKLGKEEKAAECASYTPIISETPPPGWRPTAGETVRGTKTVPIEIQQAQHASADKDIQAREEWEREQAKLKQEAELEHERQAHATYREYLRYYSYPYYGIYTGFIVNDDDYYIYAWTGRPVWTARAYPEVYNWALWNLGRYHYVDGIYISVDID